MEGVRLESLDGYKKLKKARAKAGGAEVDYLQIVRPRATYHGKRVRVTLPDLEGGGEGGNVSVGDGDVLFLSPDGSWRVKGQDDFFRDHDKLD